MTVPDNAVTRPAEPEDEQPVSAGGPFAGLTGLDVIDGELVPRRRQARS